MKYMVNVTPHKGVKEDEIKAEIKEAVKNDFKLWDIIKKGFIKTNELYFKVDKLGVVFFIECFSEEEVRSYINELHVIQKKVMNYEIERVDHFMPDFIK